MFWGLHGRIFYLAIRRFVYMTPTPAHLDDIVRDAVTAFLDGSKALMPKLVQPPAESDCAAGPAADPDSIATRKSRAASQQHTTDRSAPPPTAMGSEGAKP
jgi:hypothetical protein